MSDFMIILRLIIKVVLILLIVRPLSAHHILYVELRKAIVLSCNIECQSESYWQKGEELLYINRINTNRKFADTISLARNYSLLINLVDFEHEGTYCCFNANITVRKYILRIKGLYMNDTSIF